MSITPEVVTGIARCREISLGLLKESVVAMDSEGVQLGRDGPLTLLQIGTMDGHVYLFDVLKNRNLFKKGHLADVLQSNDVIKVIHSCSGDSAALYHQFGITLRNVFDTQIAHLLIEESKGRRLPSLVKLEVICQMYSEKATVAENKDELAELWCKEIGDLWARRPLTEDMIKYAAGDVTALIPEVYATQKSFIESRDLWKEFGMRVEENIMYDIDDEMKSERFERLSQIVNEIVGQFDTKYADDTELSEITDEDDLKALQRLGHKDAAKMSPLIKRLKTESIIAKLQELDEQIEEYGKEFRMNWRPHIFFSEVFKHPKKEIRNDAKRIRNRIYSITLADISRKYDTSTTINMVSKAEKDALRSMYLEGPYDSSYDDTQLHLYWSLMLDDVNRCYEKFREYGKKFKMREKNYKKLKFFYSGDVPPFLKARVKRFFRDLDRTFGKRKVPIKH